MRRSIANLFSCVLLGILMLGIALGASSVSATPEKAATFYEDALKRFEKGDFEGSVVQLKNSLQQDNKLVAAHMLMGRALFRSGDLNGAEAALEEALKLGVNRGEVAVLLGRIYLIMGKPEKVIDRFAASGLPAAVQAQVLSLRGTAYFEMGNVAMAGRSFDDAVLADPSSPIPWIDKVPFLSQTGQKDQARAAAARAIQLGPNLATAWTMQGSTLQGAFDFKGALAAYDKALELDARHIGARIARSGLLLDVNRDSDAAKELAILAEQAPEEPSSAYLRALLAARKNDQTVATRELGTAAHIIDSIAPQLLERNEHYMMVAALAHHGLGNMQKAREYLDKIIARNPKNLAARKLLASVFLRIRNYTLAEENLRSLQRVIPNDPQVLFMQGSLNLAQRRFSQASELLERAAKAGDSPEVNRALGFSQLNQGRDDVGIVALEKAFSANAGDFEAGNRLAMVYLRKGQKQKAVQVVEAMLKADPSNLTNLNFLGAIKAGVGDKIGARKAYTEVLAADPNFIPTVLNLARMDSSEGKVDDARRRLEVALAKFPDHVDALYELGALERRLGRNAEAMRSFRKASDMPKADARPGLALVDLQIGMRQFAEAVETAKSFATKFPDSLQIQMALARAHLAIGDASNARQTLSAATKMAGFNTAAQVVIGRMQLAAGNPDGAAYNFQKAFQDSPGDLGALILAVDIEIQRGDFAKADVALKGLSAKHPARVETTLAAARLAMARGQYPAAISAYRSALTKAESPEVLLGLVRAQIAGGEVTKAVPTVEAWVKARPNDMLALALLAETQFRAGRLVQAKAGYEKLLAVEKDDVMSLNNYANVLFRLNDPAALAQAERAYKLAPGNPDIADTLGWILVRQGKVNEGLRHLRDARLRSPGSPEIRYHLAYALAKAGRNAEAKEELAVIFNTQGVKQYSEDVQKLKVQLGL